MKETNRIHFDFNIDDAAHTKIAYRVMAADIKKDLDGALRRCRKRKTSDLWRTAAWIFSSASKNSMINAGTQYALYAFCCGLIAMMATCGSPDSDSSFHPNGRTILAGAIVCPDSVDTRSEFHKGIQGAKIADQIVQSGDSKDKYFQALLEVNKTYKTDFSSYGCTELEAGVTVYIESEDATGIATITAKLPDKTLLHGITYASEIQSDASGK